MPVEDELVLAADEPAEGDAGDVLARALGEHPLALGALAGVVGGGGDVDDQRRAGERLLAGGRPGLPDVLADGQADARAAPSSITAPAGAGLEVALLVEDAVVGQVDLAVDRVHAPVGEHGGGVVDVLGALGEADDRRRARRRVGGERARARARRRRGSAPSAAGPRAGSRSARARGTARARRPASRARARCRRGCARRCRRCRRRWRSVWQRARRMRWIVSAPARSGGLPQ